MESPNDLPSVTVDKNKPTDFDILTKDTVEAELRKLKLIDDDYMSDSDDRDRIRLTGKGIDFKALKAGQDVEFEFDPEAGEDNYNWEDENDEPIDYELLFKHRNMDMIGGENDEEVNNVNNGDTENKDNNNNDEINKSVKTPFEILRLKMNNISPHKDDGVLKRTLLQGTGLPVPKGSRVRIHYNAYFEMNSEPFDSTYLRQKTFEFKLGASEVVYGLDVSVGSMKKQEKSQFIFEPDYYCGKYGCPPRVPPDTPVLFEIEVISFIEANAYDTYEVTPEEQRKKLNLAQILQICNCLRELGNDNYGRKLYKEASKKYRKSIYLLENTNVKDDEEEIRWKSVMLKLNLNMSAVCLKQSKPKNCIFYCKASLDFDPQNVKSLYRYGQSLRILQDFERSKKFLIRAYNLSPSNKDIANEIEKLNEMVGKYNMLEKDIYKKMFNNKTNKPSAIKEGNEKSSQSNGQEFIMTEKDSLEKARQTILTKLKEFIANENVSTFTVQLDMYSLEIINFMIAEAEKSELIIRNIKGATNIMQIMKS